MREQAKDLTRLEQLTENITGAISILAIIGILAGAVVVVGDVLGRWILGTSVFALNEIMSLTFAIAIAATLPAGAARRVNLRIDLFAQMTGPKVQGWLNVATSVLLMLFFAILSWATWDLADRYLTQGRATTLLELSLYPVYYFVAVTMAATALVQAVNVLVDTRAALAPKEGNRTHPIFAALLALMIGTLGWVAYWGITDWNAVTNFVYANPSTTVLIAFGLLWLGVFAQLPLATVTGGLGIVGVMFAISGGASINTFAGHAMDFLKNEQVATLPLFLIMGAFSVVAGVSTDLFQLGHVLLGRFKGGLAYATIAGCAGFGAVTGNSIVTSATFGRMALPEMKRLGYAPTLSTATVAAGGTLGALVPPSGVIILFALLTEESIGALFIAAMLPALLAVLLYFAAVFFVVLRKPDEAPASDKASGKEVLAAFIGAGPVVGMFTIVIGGLYSGIFTVTESAAVGAVAAFALALMRGKLNKKSLLGVFSQTTGTVAMIYGMIFGGLMFSFFVNLTGAPDIMAAWIDSIDARPIYVLIVLIIIYLLLGSVMDSFGVMIITLPVITPIIIDLGYDMLFWGILMLVVVEIGMITPPFGMNLFILKNIDPDVKLTTVMRGVLPFVTADLVKIILIVAFPALSLWLPSTMN